MKRELVRVQVEGQSVFLYIGSVAVNVWFSGDVEADKRTAEALAASIQKELDKEFQARAAWIAKESRYREVRHY